MATWRRSELERKRVERSRKVAQVLRIELLVAIAGFAVAGLALWQAMAAQSRADLLAHDLAAAQTQLRAYETSAPMPTTPAATSTTAPAPLLPPLPQQTPPPSRY